MSDHSYFDSIRVFEIYDHAIYDIAPIQLLSDGSCEGSGTSEWTSENDSILSKDTSIYYGTYCIKVEYDGTDYAGAYQSVKLVTGKKYRLCGYGQGSSASGFSVIVDGEEYEYETDSIYKFDIAFTCSDSTNNTVHFRCLTNSSGGWAKFDHIYFVEYDGELPLRRDRMNHWPDGYCDDPNVSSTVWGSTNSNLIKDSANKLYGDYALACYPITSGTVQVIKEGCCIIGRSYIITGYIKLGDTSIAHQLRNGTTNLWTSTTDSGWQYFIIRFTATDTDMDIYYTASDSEDFCFIDHVYLQEIPPANNECDCKIDKIGRNLYSNYPNHVLGYCDMNGLDNNWCVSIDTKISDPNEWFIPFGVDDDFHIVCGANNSGSPDYEDYEDAITLKGGLLNGNSFVSEYPISDDEWHNIIVDCNSIRSVSTELWVDGEKVGSDNLSIPTFNGLSYFGSREPNPSGYSLSDGYISNVSIYNSSKSDEEKRQIFRNFVDVFWGGIDNRELVSGISKIDSDITINNRTVRRHELFNANDFSNGDTGHHDLVISGSGDSPSITDAEYSSDKAVEFFSGEYFEGSDSSIGDLSDGDSFVITVLCKNIDGTILSKFEDTNNYWNIYINSGILYFNVSSGGIYSDANTSDVSGFGDYLYIDIFVSLNNSYCKFIVNGSDLTQDGFLLSYSDISNGGNITISDSYNCIISYISICKSYGWF